MGTLGEWEALINDAIRARGNAYAPYSKFKVGAALLGESGAVYTGCNVENASYGLAVCAERSALARAVADGERRFRAIAIVSDAGEPCAPCGACRQALYEFNPDMLVVMARASGEPLIFSLSELLPQAFGPQNLAGNRPGR